MEDLFGKLQKQANWGVILVSDKEHVQKTEDQSVNRLQVGVIAGKSARNHDAFMKSLWSPLHLPSYFGENWDAFDEVIHDLSWLQADAYLFILTDAHLLLDENDADFKIFLQLCEEAHRDWMNVESEEFVAEWTNESKPMFFVFQVGNTTEEAELADRLKRLNKELPVIAGQ
jgi:hypothetical protein